MALYRVIVKESVSKDLKKIPKKDVHRILSAIRTLAEDPRPPQSKKLSGQDRYRGCDGALNRKDRCDHGDLATGQGGEAEDQADMDANSSDRSTHQVIVFMIGLRREGWDRRDGWPDLARRAR